MATNYGRSNGSFQRVLPCSAGGPGFDSQLSHILLRCSMQMDVDGSGQTSTIETNYFRSEANMLILKNLDIEAEQSKLILNCESSEANLFIFKLYNIEAKLASDFVLEKAKKKRIFV